MATEKAARSNPNARKEAIDDFAAGLMDLDGASEFKNIMIHGDSGAGKTVLAGTMPGRVLFLAGEPGYISAARRGAKGKVRIIPDTATALAAIDWLEDGAFKDFDWIIPDGISTMQNKFLLNYAAEAFDANPAKRAHRNLPDKPDYFNAQNFIKGWVSRFIDLPCNVLFTAHSMRPEESGETMVYPAIQGKGYEVSNYVCGLMHVVGYMETVDSPKGIDGQSRRILWKRYHSKEKDTTYFAKDQFDRMPLYTDDWTMPQILARLDSDEPATPLPEREEQEEVKPAVRRKRRTT